jgi:hypothetical protein
LIDETQVNFIMQCIYEHRKNLLIICAKSWELIIKRINPSGLFGRRHSFLAALVIQ